MLIVTSDFSIACFVITCDQLLTSSWKLGDVGLLSVAVSFDFFSGPGVLQVLIHVGKLKPFST